jgi:hypothetical protein
MPAETLHSSPQESQKATTHESDAVTQLENMFQDRSTVPTPAEAFGHLKNKTETTPVATKATSDLAETAITSSTEATAQVAPETPADDETAHHHRHDSARQHAQDLHTRFVSTVKSSGERWLAKLPTVKVQKQESIDTLLERIEANLDADPEAAPQSQEETKKENVPMQSHKEFVKQQEELWGAKDTIKPEDVPEGELTYEQYLARRPKLQEGDAFHTGDRVFGMVDGRVRPVKRQGYENSLEAQSQDAYYDQSNETHYEATSETIRRDIEGEVIVGKSEQLSALLALGNEITSLKTSDETLSDETKKAIEVKSQMFDDLKGLYESKGLDPRGFAYIDARLNGSSAETPKGYASRNGERVTITDVTLVDGETAYEIENGDGSIEADVRANHIDFEQERPDVEWKEGIGERVKKWFGKQKEYLRQYGGRAYMGHLFTSALDKVNSGVDKAAETRAAGWAANILNFRIKEGMSEEEKDKIRNQNRRGVVLGAGILAVAAIGAGVGIGIGSALSHGGEHGADVATTYTGGTGGGESGHDMTLLAKDRYPASGGVDVLPLTGGDSIDPSVIEGTPSFNVELMNNVPSGMGGEDLFRQLGIDPSKWYNNQNTLIQFSDDFYPLDGGVGIKHSGQLSAPAQAFINSLR